MTNKIKIAILLFVSILIINADAKIEAPLQTAAQVDLNRYLGKWYEIASYPMFFQRGCYCTTAQYKQENKWIGVVNSCRSQSPQGKLRAATAKAYPVPNSNNSKLKIQFFWPFKADYWILYVDDNYRYAIVSVPSRKYLWILSRTPVISQQQYEKLLKIVDAQGFDLTRLKRTDQSCL